MSLPRCLVVDPDHAFADILARIIRRHGFETVVLHDPLAALGQLREVAFDLILFDLSLPEGHFLMVLETIRREIPAILEHLVIVTTNPLVASEVPVGVPVVGKSDLRPLMDYLNR